MTDRLPVTILSGFLGAGRTTVLNRSEEKLAQKSNGCFCCTQLKEVGKLARKGRFDYLFVESTGISEPLPVAETFTFADETGKSLSS